MGRNKHNLDKWMVGQAYFLALLSLELSRSST